MVKRMLIDATQPEETRVAILNENRLEEFDYESAMRKPLKGNIYLAKITRVEPSLQAAFVSYGGNRHGFLPFSEIHPDYFRIPVADQEEFARMQQEQLEEHDKREESVAEPEATDKASEDENEASDDENVNEIVDDQDTFNNKDTDSDAEGNADTVEDPKEDQAKQDAEETDIKSDANIDEQVDEEKTSDTPIVEVENAETPENTEDDSAETTKDDNTNADEEQDGDKDAESSEDAHKKNNRGRGRGKGRNNKGRRSNFRSRRPENFGNDVAGQAQRFRFNLRRKYKIQEVIKRGQIMLIQVAREERGNKGAAVSSYLSLPGRYCVLMPNSPRGGGVSRKISNQQERSKMKDLLSALEVPAGMSTIVRTAGVTRTKPEVKRDLDYLMRLWNSIRELTLKSTAPALVYEEADLIKRSVRDQYTRDIEEIVVAGENGYKIAKNFMKMIIPSHAKRVKHYDDENASLFHKYKIERQIAEIGETEVTLPSGGYLVINPTEALISVDVNSGRATKERNIEGTALRTNLEAAEEVARQLRLRDLGGLVVIDFIDMENRGNNGKVERKMRDALSIDRARVQVGRISSFGLMELSRQRLSASLSEAQFEVCPHCEGKGSVRTADSASLLVLRAIEAEGVRKRAAQVIAHVPAQVALYLLNHKRALISDIEGRYNIEILIRVDDTLSASTHRVEVSKPLSDEQQDSDEKQTSNANATDDENGDDQPKKSRRGRRGGRGRNKRKDENSTTTSETSETSEDENTENKANATDKVEPADKVSSAAETVDQDEKAEKPKTRRRRSPKKKDSPASSDTNVDETKSEESVKPEVIAEEKPAKSEKPKRGRKPAKKKSDLQEEAKPADDAANDDKGCKASDTVETPATPDNTHAQEQETVNEAPQKKKRGWWSRK